MSHRSPASIVTVLTIAALGGSARADQNDAVVDYAKRGTVPTQYEPAAVVLTDAKICGFSWIDVEQQKVGNGWSAMETQAMGLPVRVEPCAFPKEANGKWTAQIAALKRSRAPLAAQPVVIDDPKREWHYTTNARGEVIARDFVVKIYRKDIAVRLFCGVADPNVICERSSADNLERVAQAVNEAQYRKAEGERLKSTDTTTIDERTGLAPAAKCQVVAYRMVGVARFATSTIEHAITKGTWNAKARFLLRDGTTKSADEIQLLAKQLDADGAALFAACKGTVALPKELVVR